MTAVLLAGGQSRRMGRDKSLLKFGEETVVEYLTALFSGIFAETMLIVNRREKLKGLNLVGAAIYEDLLPGRGPLAAVYTGLRYAGHQAACVFTCDMPLVDEMLIRELVDFWEEGSDVVCLEDSKGKYQPFPGIYSRESYSFMAHFLRRGEGSMGAYLSVASVKPLILKEEKIAVLTNMNYIEDYYRVLKEKEWY